MVDGEQALGWHRVIQVAVAAIGALLGMWIVAVAIEMLPPLARYLDAHCIPVGSDAELPFFPIVALAGGVLGATLFAEAYLRWLAAKPGQNS